MIRAAIALAALAAPAAADMGERAHIVQFNGYTVTVDTVLLNPGEVPRWATEVADQACASAGRPDAQAQRIDPEGDHRARVFFVCM